MAGPALPALPPLPSAKGKKKETPQQRAASAAAYQQAKAQNPYFQGQLYLSKKQELDTIWEAYTGHNINDQQARRIITLGWSNYHLQLWLSGQKSFINSPVWRTEAPGYTSVYQSIYGPKAKPDSKLLAYAIIHNLGSSGFQEILRAGKNYVQSEEFKANTAQLENVYRSIFGNPDKNAGYVIKQATLADWSADQFGQYLRSQPEYRQSSEYQNNVQQLAQVFGGNVTMSAQQALAPASPHSGLPHDNRLGTPPWEQQQQQQNQQGTLQATPMQPRPKPTAP